MKRMALGSLVLALAVMLALPGWAQDEKTFDRVQIRLNYWTADYLGKVRLEDKDVLNETDNIIGEEVNLVDDLGLETPKAIPEIELLFRLSQRHRILLSYYAVDYSGETDLDSNLEFIGYKFEANTSLKTQFQLYRIMFLYDYVPLQNDRGHLGIVFGVEYYSWRVGYKGIAEKAGAGVAVDDAKTLPIPMPVIGLEGGIVIIDGLEFYGRLAGMGAKYQDISGSYIDLDTGLSWGYKNLYVGAGYRLLQSRLDANLDDDKSYGLQLANSGWLISVGARF